MKLLDAIFLSAQMPEDSVICAREPFHQSTEAVIVQFAEDFSIPPQVTQEGYVYFLETDGVSELLEISQKRNSRETKAEFVFYYASWDAYPAFYNDLEDVATQSQ
ncbi:hypothetical protein [Massilia sp. BKSP1R2A-1]|uniref:hypothetical protein n=1 Tax=Massilia sp. BKSP1R2A-1 TaxID=3422595 RepID=UPI003D32A500